MAKQVVRSEPTSSVRITAPLAGAVFGGTTQERRASSNVSPPIVEAIEHPAKFEAEMAHLICNRKTGRRGTLNSNRQIGWLLDFQQIASLAYGMGVPALHIDDHPRLNLDAVHAVKHPRNILRSEKLLPALARNPLLKVVVHAGPGCGGIAATIQKVPALSLPVRRAEQRFRARGIGVNLNGKAFPCIDKFDENAQPTALSGPARAEHAGRIFLNELFERFTRSQIPAQSLPVMGIGVDRLRYRRDPFFRIVRIRHPPRSLPAFT